VRLFIFQRRVDLDAKLVLAAYHGDRDILKGFQLDCKEVNRDQFDAQAEKQHLEDLFGFIVVLDVVLTPEDANDLEYELETVYGFSVNLKSFFTELFPFIDRAKQANKY
jgi:hypothetical protein